MRPPPRPTLLYVFSDGGARPHPPASSIAIVVKNERNIDVCFFTRGLRFRARASGEVSGFGQLRLMQVRFVDDTAKQLALARVIVGGKLTNQRRLLLRHMAETTPPVVGIARVLTVLPGVRDLEVLRGHEGQGAAVYFDGLRSLIPNIAEWGFTHRDYHPPPDPINALLSYSYSLLTREVLAAVYRVGLDPFLGVFHALHYGRPSLALDLVEEFRPLIADTLMLNLVRGGHITPADFSRADADGKAQVLLTPAARTRLLEAYERRLAERVAYGAQGNRQTYRQCIELQTRQLARLVLGETDRYVPLVLP